MALSSSNNIRNLITTSAVTSALGGTDHCRIWPISRYSQQTVTTASNDPLTLRDADKVIIAANTVCGAGSIYVTVGCLSVFLSRRLTAAAAGLLMSTGACRRYRLVAGTRWTRSAANAGSVTLRAECRGSTPTCYLCVWRVSIRGRRR